MVRGPAISSMSLGRAAVHKLPKKLDQAKKYGFKGIELFYEDLEYFANENEGGSTPASLIEAAKKVRQLCDERGIEVVGLQPFMHYEGLRDREVHSKRIAEMRLWLKLAKILGTNLIQIPSSFLSKNEITSDLDIIVDDFREVAELGLSEEPVMNFAYESLAWGTYSDTWEQSWNVVQAVDMPNFGIILDTFNIAARAYADPASMSGKIPNAEAAIKASIQRLIKTIDVRKVFFVQLVDAERLSRPLTKGHEYYSPSQPARMSWSRNCRLFYGEQNLGGYLPIKDLAEAILKDVGYDGWVSAELFTRVMADPGADVPERLARRGATSWKKLVKDLDLKFS